MLLVDLPESGTVDWDSLGFRCRETIFHEHAEGPEEESGQGQRGEAGTPSGVTYC